MTINVNQLIAAPMLQDYFVDSVTGGPLSAGIITCYRDNNRTTLKNWYYQSGSPNNYTYIQLPNPMTLSAVGTIVDVNGNDTIPFFYPYDENDNTVFQPYYITVDNSDGQRQFTRQNFPFVPQGQSPTNTVATNNNLICNGEFWRNIGSVAATTLTNSVTINGTTIYYTTIVPSQHDGFTMPDISFFKDENGAVDVLTFENFVSNFPDQTLPDSITPEFYLNVQCTGMGSETVKYVQIPIQLHVDSLSGVTTCSATLEAMAVNGSPTITLGIFQFLGSGVASPAVVPLMTIPLSNAWQKYTAIFTMPSANGRTLGTGGDDALYLQIGFQAATIYNINIAMPGLYLAEVPPTNDFQTYDQINAIISSPRTGDIRTSLNTFYPYGWVPMNNGTICNSGSITPPANDGFARQNIDTWPLFDLIWTSFKQFDAGGINKIAQMYDSTGSTTSYGSTAIGDWTALKQLALTKSMGEVILGTAPISSLLPPYSTTVIGSSSSGLALTTASDTAGSGSFFNGMPFYVYPGMGGTLPSGMIAYTIYYVANYAANRFNVATTFANAMAGTVLPYVNSGTAPINLISALAGSYEGEYAHSQLIAELAAHNHPGSTVSLGLGNFGGGSGNAYVANSPSNLPLVTVATQGSGTPFNVTQPGVFMNLFMKL